MKLFVLLTTLLQQITWTLSQPADLGAFGSQNDVQPGVIYSFPSEVGRGSHPSAEYYALAYLNYSYIRPSDGHHVVYAQETAKYGEGLITSVMGPLVHVTNLKNKSDHTACSSDLTGTLGRDLPDKGWIALIKRGDCKFDDKVRIVYSKGAIGAIVYDYKEVPSLDKMKIDDRTRKLMQMFANIIFSIFFFMFYVLHAIDTWIGIKFTLLNVQHVQPVMHAVDMPVSINETMHVFF